jgi:hypothetical protein
MVAIVSGFQTWELGHNISRVILPFQLFISPTTGKKNTAMG